MELPELNTEECEEVELAIKDIADICSELGGIFDVEELADGASAFCNLRDKMNLNFKYEIKPHEPCKSKLEIEAGSYRDKPEFQILIGEPTIYYDDDDKRMVIESREIHASLSKYGRLNIIDSALDNYYRRLAQY